MEEITEKDLVSNNGSNEQMSLSDISLGYLKETAKWARFMAILGFIGIGFMVLGGLIMMSFGSAMGSIQSDANAVGFNQQVNPISPFWMALIYLVFAVLYYFPVNYLYRFAKKCVTQWMRKMN